MVHGARKALQNGDSTDVDSPRPVLMWGGGGGNHDCSSVLVESMMVEQAEPGSIPQSCYDKTEAKKVVTLSNRMGKSEWRKCWGLAETPACSLHQRRGSLKNILSCWPKALGEGCYRWCNDQVLKAIDDSISIRISEAKQQCPARQAIALIKSREKIHAQARVSGESRPGEALQPLQWPQRWSWCRRHQDKWSSWSWMGPGKTGWRRLTRGRKAVSEAGTAGTAVCDVYQLKCPADASLGRFSRRS